jgi:lysophospholipase L1-like esterase
MNEVVPAPPMKNKTVRTAAALLALVPALFAQEPAVADASTSATAKKPAAPVPAAPRQAPDVPAPKVTVEGLPNKVFHESHERYVAQAKKGGIDLLFLGDSITLMWNREIWNKAFGNYRAANFGVGGDRTQHVLWRIQNGELDGITPKVIVLMIGTNNSAGDPPEGTANGIKKIVETIRAKSPATKILLMGIFPRGNKSVRQREVNNAVNAIISKLGDDKHVFYMDIGEKFLTPDGTLTPEIAPGFLHLSPKGYQIWADAILPKLAELMK